MSFSSYVIRWKTECRLTVSEGWKITQDQMLRDHIEPILGQILLQEVAPVHISKVMSFCQSKNLSNATQKQVYLLLNKMFNDAVIFFEYIEKSPVRRLYHKPKHVPSKRLFLKPSIAWEFLAVMTEDRRWGVAVWLQVVAGLRVSEVQGLKWKDIDFDGDTILIERIYNRKTKKIQPYTKNRTHHKIPIPPILKSVLKRHRARLNDFVCSGDGGKMLSYNSYQKALRRITLKLCGEALSTHELRHTCSELWIDVGASMEDIRRLLNHCNLESTRVYIHETENRLQNLSMLVSSKKIKSV